MKEIYPIVKDLYYKKENNNYKVREAVRGFLFKDNKFCLIHIKGEDKFGKRDHFETPGGGVENNEDYITTLKREMSEETGYSITNIKEIGKIAIEYNIISRIDVEYFYYCEAFSLHETHLLDYEKELFSNLEWFTIDEAIDMYKYRKVQTVGSMIHERDYNALLYLKNYILKK